MSRSSSGTAWLRVFTLTALTITAVAACTGTGSGANGQPGAAPGAAASGATITAASPVDQTNLPSVTELTADMYAARSQHDMRASQEFRRRLLAAAGADVVAQAHSE